MTTNTNAALRSAAESALEALEILNGIDTETESVTIHVSDETAALRAALTAAAAVPPEGVVMVPVELAERVQESLGEFLMDHGWSQRDMDTSDDFGAVLLAARSQAKEGA